MKKKKKRKKNSKFNQIPNKISEKELKKIISNNKKRNIKDIEQTDPIKTIKKYEKEIEIYIKDSFEQKDFPWVFFKKTILHLIEELIKPHDYLIENTNFSETEKIENFIKDKNSLLIAFNLIKEVYVGKYDNY
mgnify:FL=1